MERLKKAAMFSDIHFGRKSNSIQHNEDCTDYINWFCDYVKHHDDIDHIYFLGDWHESRNALNVVTLNHSYKAAKILNELNLPIFFCVGNHDLYYKNSRDVYSVVQFNEFSNFNIVNSPTVIKNTTIPTLLCPYMFVEEYVNLRKYEKIPIWIGHFEFRGFVVTGQTITLTAGPDPDNFIKPKRIFSGHFHKRQTNKNITYIGNTFPMDFSDVNDNDRGLAVYDYESNELIFENWNACPKYVRVSLSNILDEKTELAANSRVQCYVDEDLSYQEKNNLQKKFTEKYNLRELILNEITDTNNALTQTNIDSSIIDSSLLDVDHIVLQMLSQINDKQINNTTLREIYNNLQPVKAMHND